MTENPSTLSSPNYHGTVKEVVRLFLPILLMTFSTSIVSFGERAFFGQLSAELLEAVVSVTYVTRIFLLPCMALVTMAQVYVGRLQGARDEHSIGRHIWQFIWLAVLSALVTGPLCLLYGSFYFQGTVIQDSVFFYLPFMACVNFLFPLASSLSCFYLGRARIWMILGMTLAIDAFNLLLAYLFIFGVDGWIPSFGLIGAASATLIAQGLFCLILLRNFLSQKNAQTFGTYEWRFRPKLFRECLIPGVPRALNTLSLFVCWAFITHLMIDKQGDYLLFWSLGSAIGLFLPFIGTAMCQALTIMLSHMLGAGQKHRLKHAAFSGFLVITAVIVLTTVPLLFFPLEVCSHLFPSVAIAEESVRYVFFAIFLSFTFGTYSFIGVSYILAFKDTRFLLKVGPLCWLNGFALMYLMVCVLEISANQCLVALSLASFVDLCLYSWRAFWLVRQEAVQEWNSQECRT